MKIALVSLSDPFKDYENNILNLTTILEKNNFEVDNFIDDNFANRLKIIDKIYKEKDYDYIFDCSGGNLANSFLDYLNYDLIKESDTIFVGYSDLTTIINSIYQKTKKPSILYCPRFLIVENQFISKKTFEFDFNFRQGDSLQGVLIGGNLRCFLKLAGTCFFPELDDKILFLESYGGDMNFITSCLNQLRQMDAFRRIKGLIVGSFTEFESKYGRQKLLELFDKYSAGKTIIETTQVGHQKDSKAIYIGKNYYFDKNGLKFDFDIKLK